MKISNALIIFNIFLFSLVLIGPITVAEDETVHPEFYMDIDGSHFDVGLFLIGILVGIVIGAFIVILIRFIKGNKSTR